MPHQEAEDVLVVIPPIEPRSDGRFQLPIKIQHDSPTSRAHAQNLLREVRKQVPGHFDISSKFDYTVLEFVHKSVDALQRLMERLRQLLATSPGLQLADA